MEFGLLGKGRVGATDFEEEELDGDAKGGGSGVLRHLCDSFSEARTSLFRLSQL